MSYHIGNRVSGNTSYSIFTGSVPDAFVEGMWSILLGNIVINSLPDSGRLPIRDIEYRVNEGAAISLGETTTGSFEITADVDDDVQIRAVNAIGPGDWSDTKLMTAPLPVQASGGVETVINPAAGEFYRVHTFLEDGDLTVTQGGAVEYLVVAGGGGGCGNTSFSNAGGGGGGAGGFVSSETLGKHTASQGTHSVVVGLGGAGFNGSGTGDNGENSSVFGLVALGGGGGSVNDDASNGGSGGGSRGTSSLPGSALQPASVTGGLGNDGGAGGGDGGAGGGGASQAGASVGAGGQGGKGGDGAQSNITGVLTYYAGGGGGGRDDNSSPLAAGGLGGGGRGSNKSNAPLDGAQNTGGGGGGGGDSFAGANGGSGIVIIRYPISESEYNAEAA